MSFQPKWADLKLDGAFSNAAGVCCTTREELDILQNCPHISVIVTKSCSLNKREGNPKPRYMNTELGSINSMGLPNLGYKFYVEYCKNSVKPCILSIANINTEETNIILNDIKNLDYIKYPEINVSCPNIPGKEQLGYRLNDLEIFIKETSEIYGKPFGLKLPPYFDETHFPTVANIINKFPLIKYVTCINSIGNGLLFDIKTKKPLILPKEGLGGIGGEYILPTAVANVYKFRKLLRQDIDVIACGGITNGEDVCQHYLAGASFFQVGTHIYKNGPNSVAEINNKFKSFLHYY